MREANRLAPKIGWRAAVERVIGDKDLCGYICAPWRGDFQKLWTLPRDSSSLDVGAGWGGIASASPPTSRASWLWRAFWN